MATLLSVSGMAARTLGVLLMLVLRTTICEAASFFHPISDSHRSAASELFTEESFGSLEEAYEALRSFEVLGIDKPDIPGATCESVVEKLGSSPSAPKGFAQPKAKHKPTDGMATLLSVSGMAARTLGVLLVLVLRTTICEAASVFHPISDSHRSAASELFTEESFGRYHSLEEPYEALRSFEVLGIDKPDIRGATCESVVEKLGSLASAPKDLFYALKVNSILKGEVKKEVFKGIASRHKAVVNGASSLLDIYNSIDSLVLIKDQTSEVNVLLADADGIFRSIKSLSQSDGRRRYSSDNPQGSTYAAGLAIEALAGVVSLASSEIDQSMIGKLKRDVSKLFDSVEKYDDGAFYFDEKVDQSPLSTTASVVQGLTALAAVTSEKLKVPGEIILGLAKFFLGIAIPGNNKDFINQIDSLASLESNNVSVPLILLLPTTVLPLTKKDQLKICLRESCGLVCWCIVLSEERKVSYVHLQSNVAVVLKVQSEHMIISYADVQNMCSFPVRGQMEIATKVKRKARPPYGGDDKDKVDMGPAVNVYRITADAVVHEIGEIHPLSYNGDSYGLHNAVLSIVQAHISSGGLFGYVTPTLQQFEIVYYHDPHNEDGSVIRLNCPELLMPYYYFSNLLSGVAICDFDSAQFLVP